MSVIKLKKKLKIKLNFRNLRFVWIESGNTKITNLKRVNISLKMEMEMFI